MDKLDRCKGHNSDYKFFALFVDAALKWSAQPSKLIDYHSEVRIRGVAVTGRYPSGGWEMVFMRFGDDFLRLLSNEQEP